MNPSTYTPQPTPPAPTRSRWNPLTAAIIATAAFVAGGAVGGAFGASAGGPHTACTTALDHANEAMAIYSSSLHLAADGIQGYSNDDPWAIREASDGIQDKSAELEIVLEDFFVSEMECRG